MIRMLVEPIGSARELAVLGVGVIGLSLALFFSAQAGLLVLAAAWIAVGAWRYPWPAFLLLIAVAPFLLILKATVVLGALTLLKDVVILTLFVKTLARGGVPRLGVLALPVAALVLWAGLAFLRADAPVLGFLRLRDLLLYAPMLVVAAHLVDSETRLSVLLRVFLGSAAAVLLLGLAQWVFSPDGMVLRFDPSRSVWIPRAASVLAHPNILGSYLLFVVPLAGTLVVTRANGRMSHFAFLVFAASLVAAYATYSRSAWLALAASLAAGVFLLAIVSRPRLVLGAAALAAAIGALALSAPRTRALLVSITDPAYESNRTRLDIAAGVFGQVSRSGVVIGEGLGDTARLLDRQVGVTLYEVAAAGAREVQVAKARTFVDNAVLKTFIEQGVVGLVIAGWVAVRLFVAATGVARRGSGLARSVSFALASTIVGLAALWLFLDVPDIFPVNLYFWTFAGLVASGAASRSSPEV